MEKYKKQIRPFFDAQFARLDRNIQQKYKGNRNKQLPEETQLKTFITESIGHLMDSIADRKDEENILIHLYNQFEKKYNEAPKLPDRF